MASNGTDSMATPNAPITSVKDLQIAALATGFWLGFGFLTVWEAIKQTKRNMNRYRSLYIYMVWGEIIANIGLMVVGWLFLHGVVGATVPVLFFILFPWIFQIQLLMQIIINRIALIAENRKTIFRIKWGTAALITAINISVFCIWIPSHITTPVPVFVRINTYWDKCEKVLIMFVDAFLNLFFLTTVNRRLVKQHGLIKYKPLVGFNARLMVISVCMDGMLIGLMFLKNPLVYVIFHPVVYTVKLNIEMSMASLVIRLAKGQGIQDKEFLEPYHMGGASQVISFNGGSQFGSVRQGSLRGHRSRRPTSFIRNLGLSKIDASDETLSGVESLGGIQRTTDVNVVVEKIGIPMPVGMGGPDSSRSSGEIHSVFEDESPLRKPSDVLHKEIGDQV